MSTEQTYYLIAAIGTIVGTVIAMVNFGLQLRKEGVKRYVLIPSMIGVAVAAVVSVVAFWGPLVVLATQIGGLIDHAWKEKPTKRPEVSFQRQFKPIVRPLHSAIHGERRYFRQSYVDQLPLHKLGWVALINGYVGQRGEFLQKLRKAQGKEQKLLEKKLKANASIFAHFKLPLPTVKQMAHELEEQKLAKKRFLRRLQQWKKKQAKRKAFRRTRRYTKRRAYAKRPQLTLEEATIRKRDRQLLYKLYDHGWNRLANAWHRLSDTQRRNYAQKVEDWADIEVDRLQKKLDHQRMSTGRRREVEKQRDKLEKLSEFVEKWRKNN